MMKKIKIEKIDKKLQLVSVIIELLGVAATTMIQIMKKSSPSPRKRRRITKNAGRRSGSKLPPKQKRARLSTRSLLKLERQARGAVAEARKIEGQINKGDKNGVPAS